jgi:hypothetical protein
MALKKEECKILISQKLNNGIWEYRLSIIENLSGKNKEKIFVKGKNQQVFLENLKNTLAFHELKNFERIQRYSRYSLTEKDFLFGNNDTMKKVPEDFFDSIRKVLNEARKKILELV